MLTLFETISRNMHRGQVPQKRVSRTRRRIYAVLRFVDGITITGGLFAIAVVLIHTELLFILLPTALSIAVTALTMRSHVSTIRALLFTACLALLYFAAITSWELFSHAAVASKIVLVTTTLAAAVILEPVRAVAQSFVEQRFHLLDDTTSRTIDAFTRALREEINLDQVRDRFIQVIQATMQPRFVTLWGSAGTRNEADDVRATSDVLVSDDRLSSSTSGFTFSMYDPIVDYALRHLGAIEVTRVRLESDAVRTLRARGVELAMPLISQGKLMGLVALGPRLDGEEYSRDDRRLLNTLTAQAAPALRTAQLVLVQQAEVRERERIEQELRTAQQIQRTFLPKDSPVLSGWRVLPYYQPAREVGGDFYDFLRLADGRLGIVIGDVSGKGIPAALVMTATRTMIRTVGQMSHLPADVLARVNDRLHADIPGDMFVTCFYAVIDPTSGTIDFATAGQDPPFLRHHDGSVRELRATGMPLGMMSDTRYDQQTMTLAPGDSLLFFTDGLVEAHNCAREMFGLTHISQLVTQHEDGTELISAVMDDLQAFTGAEWEQEDDITLVTLHRFEADR